MGQHPPHLTKQPNWVAFPPETQNQLEQALEVGRRGPVPWSRFPGGSCTTRSTRAESREEPDDGVQAAGTKGHVRGGQAHGETLKGKSRRRRGLGRGAARRIVGPGRFTAKKGFDHAGLEATGRLDLQGVVLNASKDESEDLKTRGADGVSLSSGWFPEKVSDIPTADQLKEMQKAMGAGNDARHACYWDEVKDPLVAQYFPLAKNSKEYKRVYDAMR